MGAKKRRKQAAPEAPSPPHHLPNPPETNEGSPVTPVGAIGPESKRDPIRVPIVSLVASTGSLDAIKRFFAALPSDSGIAFVLASHLDSAYKDRLGEILVRNTTLPVFEAENGMSVKANHIYFMPSEKYMTIREDTLFLSERVGQSETQNAIDSFLRSLAGDQRERSICIILSGTRKYGTLGLKAVKETGGLVMVQDPSTAECEQLPRSAIATKLADYVLPVERMPKLLVKYVQHGYFDCGTEIEADTETDDDLNKVLDALWTHAKFDFRCYRKKLLARRIQRRMVLNRIDALPKYVGFLREHPDEAKQLFKDLLISVTSFFRDSEAFELLSAKIVAPAGSEQRTGCRHPRLGSRLCDG